MPNGQLDLDFRIEVRAVDNNWEFEHGEPEFELWPRSFTSSMAFCIYFLSFCLFSKRMMIVIVTHRVILRIKWENDCVGFGISLLHSGLLILSCIRQQEHRKVKRRVFAKYVYKLYLRIMSAIYLSTILGVPDSFLRVSLGACSFLWNLPLLLQTSY